MKIRTAKPASTKFVQNVLKKAARRNKNKEGGARAVNTALQLRLIRFETTQILNELRINNKVERANIHRAVQEWKKAQVDTLYFTGMKSVSGKDVKAAYNKIKLAFGPTQLFDVFVARLLRITGKTTQNMKKPSGKPVFGRN